MVGSLHCSIDQQNILSSLPLLLTHTEGERSETNKIYVNAGTTSWLMTQSTND